MREDRKRKWLRIIHEVKPTSIIEIGVAKGMTAMGMITMALDHSEHVTYDGYDLFDLATDETDSAEINGKGTTDMDRIHRRLNKIKKAHGDRFEYRLHRGFTSDTLTDPVSADFAYIDGGHSYETVKHDYNMVKGSKHVVFDDYDMPSVKQFVDELLDEFDLRFLDDPDQIQAKVMLVKKRTD